MRARFIAPGLALLLASCGGGSGSGTTPPPPAFTSGQTASIVENTTAAYQASANNPGGGTLTFSIEGGADAARFAITAAGALSFVEAPDYDLPGDADGDNVYAVRLRVSNGRSEAAQPVNITVTNSREGIAVTRIATGFDQPVAIQSLGNAAYFLVAEKGGAIYTVRTDGTRTLWKQISDISTDGEGGILGLHIYGNFSLTARALVAVTAADGAIEIRDYLYTNAGDTGTPRPDATVFRIPRTGAETLHAVMNGNLLATSDGGNPANAQDPNSPLGKLLRFQIGDPRQGPDPVLSPAPGNPYLAGGGDPYVFATGLRNPRYISSTVTFLTDSGPAAQEINRLPIGQGGANFGWPFRDGTQDRQSGAPANLVDPVAQYFAGTGPGQGSAIVGGLLYDSPRIPSLMNQYIFADRVSGHIWSVPVSGLVAGQTLPASRFARRNEDFMPDAGSLDQIVSMGFGSDARDLYLVTAAGDLFWVHPAS